MKVNDKSNSKEQNSVASSNDFLNRGAEGKSLTPPETSFEDKAVQTKSAANQENSQTSNSNAGAFSMPVQMKSNQQGAQKEAGAFQPSSGGGSMDRGVQAKMEGAFNTDFSNVNIHKDSKSAENMGAHAFAQGNDVHFAPGQYNPGTKSGQELIGHELTHVVQQRSGKVQPTTQAKGMPVNDNAGLEKEADTMGAKAAAGKSVQMKSAGKSSGKSGGANVQMKSAGVVQRQGISGSVGKGGRNRKADVKIIQRLLNRKGSRLAVDGIIGRKTIAAIKNYQSAKLRMRRPDGRVDVGGRTWRGLSSGSTSSSGGATSSAAKYTVKSGDSLSKIAKKHNMSLTKLLGLNPQITNPNRISVGQKINVGGTQTPTQAPPETAGPQVDGGANDILDNMNTTGAGRRTTKQDGQHHTDYGTAASNRMAKTDKDRVVKYAHLFREVAAQYNFPPALLAAIASRETRGRNLLFGDHGNGVGMMQVDVRYHPEKAARIRNAANKEAQIKVGIELGAEILNSMLKSVKRRKPNWSAVWQLRGAVTAYNSGAGNVQTKSGIDGGTTGDDYSADVWQRAKYYAGFEEFGSIPNAGSPPREQQEESDGGGQDTAPPQATSQGPKTANFSMAEFNSKDGVRVPENLWPKVQEVMNNLQVLRAELGNPSIRINSGYRSPSHNKNVGGVSNSRHVKGEAADIAVTGFSPNKVQTTIHRLIDEGKMKQGGVGRYNTFTHYDVRGFRSRWDNR